MIKNIVTQQIKPEKLLSVELKLVGNKNCSEQLIVINGFEFGTGASDKNEGKGINAIELKLTSNEKPKIFITYHQRLIKEEVAKSLGLKKSSNKTA